MNKEMVTSLATIGIAQLLKVPFKAKQTGKMDWGAMFETGNMPSSHSAGVTALATYIAHKKGVATVDFALAAIFGLIVMYDAQGIRRQAGELSIKVNEIDEEVEKLAGHQPKINHEKEQLRLKEIDMSQYQHLF